MPSSLTAAQLITPQLTVHNPITAHSMDGAALHWFLVLDPRVAPPEIDWKTTEQTAGSLPTPGGQDTEQPEALGVLRHRPAIPLGLWGSLPPSVWRKRLLRNAPECPRKLLQAGQHQADWSSHPERERKRGKDNEGGRGGGGYGLGAPVPYMGQIGSQRKPSSRIPEPPLGAPLAYPFFSVLCRS